MQFVLYSHFFFFAINSNKLKSINSLDFVLGIISTNNSLNVKRSDSIGSNKLIALYSLPFLFKKYANKLIEYFIFFFLIKLR